MAQRQRREQLADEDAGPQPRPPSASAASAIPAGGHSTGPTPGATAQARLAPAAAP
jgi:hypothetical protein